MNLDELVKNIQKVSDEEIVQDLANYLINWKNNNSTTENLKYGVEKFISNIWVEKTEEHNKIYKMWSTFRDDAIQKINGMTMNERLYIFGLIEKFDLYKDQEEQDIIYKKLAAEQ